jgi:transcriptional regulator GlxA family with amidase domain
MARLCALVVGNLADFGAKLAIMSIRNREVVIVGADGCLASGFLGFLDILGLAREVILSRTGEVPFDVVTASETGRAVTDGHGRSLEVQKRLSDIERCAAIVVPGFVPQGMKLPDMSAYADAADWIRREHAHGALACASCGGVYLLGRRDCSTGADARPPGGCTTNSSTAIRAATRRGDRR